VRTFVEADQGLRPLVGFQDAVDGGATMNLIFLGPPGSGKGTQAKKLYADFQVPQISTGDILRQAVKEGTELGKQAGPLMAAGKLVPDDLVVGIVEERLRQPDCQNGFVLDGFPRTIPQAQALDRALAASGKRIESVISLEVPKDLLIERQVGRRSCPKCNSIYHVVSSPPKVDGYCDKDGVELVFRADDHLDKATERQLVYLRDTSPLKDYYSQRGLLRVVDGVGSFEGIYAEIKKVIGRK
jgi:adenylate kinase